MNNFQVQKGPRALFIVLYLLLGLYFINYPFQFIQIPESFAAAEPWVIFAGGLLLIMGSIHYFQAKRRMF